ncbi:oxidoreductase, partial [Staphylococcus condimenti]
MYNKILVLGAAGQIGRILKKGLL